LLRNYEVITISESTKKDLVRYGFRPEKIYIIPEGIELTPVEDISTIQKYTEPTVLSLGTMRGMKRTKHQIQAFEIAKQTIPGLRMKIAGDASYQYGKETRELIEQSPYKNDIEYLGKVSKEKKIELMQKSHCIMVTSVKEGWGLIVTEANSQGTPAVAYDVDGLRDSIRNNETGFLAQKNTPESLAKAIIGLFNNEEQYAKIRNNAWVWSKEFNFDRTYQEFLSLIQKV